MDLIKLIKELQKIKLSPEEQQVVCKVSHGDFGEDKEYYFAVLVIAKKNNIYCKSCKNDDDDF